MSVRDFNLLEFPVAGIGAIEASAGTGKTFSISKLYLRLLLEEQARAEQIVVATYTEAAAQELKKRIYADLEAAIRTVAGAGRDHMIDLICRQARRKHREAGLEPGKVDDLLCKSLRLALLSFSRAPIGTIHGFCQRAASDYAFSGGLDLDPGDVGSGETELRRIIDKTWSAHVVDPGPAWRRALDIGYVTFRNQLRDLLRLPRQAEHSIRSTRELIGACGERLGKAVFDGLPDVVAEGLAALAGDRYAPVSAAFTKAARGFLLEHPDRPLATACECGLILAGSAELAFEAYAQAFEDVRARMAAEAAEQRLLTFDAIVEQFADAVSSSPRLAEAIRSRHPWALIDEFQDTSLDQTRAFLQIWDHPQAQGMIMIGDPKQAIYGFRGGDVHAYLRAVRHAANRATMHSNYRSVPELLSALNRLFDQRRRPFLIDGLEYTAVAPGEKSAQREGRTALKIGRRRAQALTCWFLSSDQVASGGLNSYLDTVRTAVVSEIARLLADGEFHEHQVVPSDIAVLVRRNSDALEMQRALGEQGIDAACVSEASVFESAEAAEMLAVLRAVAEPSNEALLRAALVTRLLGADREALQAWRHDEAAWQLQIDAFFQWHEAWLDGGVLTVLLEAIGAAGQRVLCWPDGARCMTNWLHLADLIQLAAAGRQGPRALISWLERQISSPDASQEAQKLRLETDADAVQIATVHRSKGLQYNIVFAPALWWQRGNEPTARKYAEPSSGPFLYHDPEHLAHFDFGTAWRDRHAQRRYEEGVGEDLRLIYVALTRARHKAYFSWGNLPTAAWRGGLQWLLCDAASRNLQGTRGCKEDDALRDQLVGRMQGRGFELVEPAPDRLPPSQLGIDLVRPDLRSRVIGNIAPDFWTITSFTRLVAGQSGAAPDRDEVAADDLEPPAVAGSGHPVFTALAGARFGQCLHEILEKLPLDDVTSLAATEVIRDALRRYGQPDSIQLVGELQELLGHVVDTELAAGIMLSQVEETRRIAEMEFHLSLAPNRTGRFRRTVVDSPWGRRVQIGQERFSHPLPVLEGVLNGFIDLTFEANGRYYLVDYKTNLLGERYDDYAPPRLHQAMADHSYHWQYLFYTLAVHRYLRAIVGAGYDYRRDFGGAYYLFVRGMHPRAAPGNGIYLDRVDFELVDELDALLGATG